MNKVAWCVVTNNKNDLISLKRFAERQQWLKSKYPVLMLIGDNISVQDLELLNGYNYKIVPNLIFNNINRYSNSFIKLNIFNCTDYDYLCYIETDILLKENIDYIIDNNISTLENNVKFFGVTKSLSKRPITLIQGFCFIIKPDLTLYNELINYEISNQLDWDELLYTKFFLEYKKFIIEDIVLLQSNLFTKLEHFPGNNKPWNSTLLPNDFTDWYNTSNYDDFNKYIDNNYNLIHYFSSLTKLVHLNSTTSSLNISNNKIIKQLLWELNLNFSKLNYE